MFELAPVGATTSRSSSSTPEFPAVFPSDDVESAGGLPPPEATKVKQNRFPPGWDEERVRRVLVHYEEQTEAEAVAEDEAAFENRKAIREIAEDEKRQKAIRAAGLRNAGRRTDEARRLSPLELVASWKPLDEDFPEIDDPPPLDEELFEDG